MDSFYLIGDIHIMKASWLWGGWTCAKDFAIRMTTLSRQEIDGPFFEGSRVLITQLGQPFSRIVIKACPKVPLLPILHKEGDWHLILINVSI